MRRKTLLILSLFAIVFMMAEVPGLRFPWFGERDAMSAQDDSIQESATAHAAVAMDAVPADTDSVHGAATADSVRSVATVDTMAMDSLQRPSGCITS